MHTTVLQYIGVITTKRQCMHDLKANFDKFFGFTKKFLPELNIDGNVKYYRHKPKMSDSEVISLSLCQESLGIDSENFFWSKLSNDYKKEFPHLIHLTRYNLRRKSLAAYIQLLNQRISSELIDGENIFLVDSMPVPICKNARENRLKACKENFETAPDKGYSAVSKQYYVGYKLHLVTSLNGVFFSMDLSKASVHDLHYLSDIKHSGLNNATLIGDAGYVSSDYQVDLFTQARINLKAPMRKNQKDYKPYPFIFRRSRKRIETIFSQLSDHMMIKRNYAKSFKGLSTRVISKVAAVTVLQMINKINGRPLNHIKHALAG